MSVGDCSKLRLAIVIPLTMSTDWHIMPEVFLWCLAGFFGTGLAGNLSVTCDHYNDTKLLRSIRNASDELCGC